MSIKVAQIVNSSAYENIKLKIVHL